MTEIEWWRELEDGQIEFNHPAAADGGLRPVGGRAPPPRRQSQLRHRASPCSRHHSDNSRVHLEAGGRQADNRRVGSATQGGARLHASGQQLHENVCGGRVDNPGSGLEREARPGDIRKTGRRPRAPGQDDEGSMSETANAANLDAMVIRAAETTVEQVAKAREAIATVVFGQTQVVENALITILAGGHGLVVGVPGLAKTKLVDTMGTVLGLEARRIQFTPDLMPSDILGSEVLEESQGGRRAFRFIKGPIFAQLLMADEINRASPRTQSALLQAMQEYHVTVAGESHDLPRPFHVLATQNPVEQEGTYPLPEAQLDRFIMQIDVGYPDAATERRILLETTTDGATKPKPAMSAEDLMAAQRLMRRLPVGESVVEAILTLVRSARPGEGDAVIDEQLAWGPGRAPANR